MTAVEKEQIFVKLRKYHTDEFPAAFGNDAMNSLLAEFRELEDKIISTMLGAVNGKAEYIDYSDDLKKFSKKIQNDFSGSEKEFFEMKINDLSEIMDLAAATTFSLKKSYAHRLVGKQVTTTITKKTTSR